jgi:hypothetical protein
VRSEELVRESPSEGSDIQGSRKPEEYKRSACEDVEVVCES